MRARGFSLIELLIAGSIFLVAIAIVYSITLESTDTARVGTAASTLEGHASRALDRIAGELIAAGLETLEPADPQGASSIVFRKSAGADGGDILWGPRSSFALRDGRVIWIRDVDDPVQEVVLCGSVPSLAQDEVANAIDDNGNGLTDEEGLSFQLTGRTLTIRLTLERKDPAAGTLARTVSTSVRLRN